MKIRFGERLRWHIEVPEDARRSAFPPMLLQPLVENAVRHGIEPKLGGGEIGIRARIEGATLRIEVSDSGVGLLGDEGWRHGAGERACAAGDAVRRGRMTWRCRAMREAVRLPRWSCRDESHHRRRRTTSGG